MKNLKKQNFDLLYQSLIKNEQQSIESSIELQIKMRLSYTSNRDQTCRQTKSDANDHEIYVRFIVDDKQTYILRNNTINVESRDRRLIYFEKNQRTSKKFRC